MLLLNGELLLKYGLLLLTLKYSESEHDEFANGDLYIRNY